MKRFGRVIIVFVGIAVVFLAVFFTLRIRTVQVKNSEIYSDEQIIGEAMADKYSYYTIYFWLVSHFGKVSCLPFTQEIEVEWNRFDSITLHAYDKTISGSVKYMGQYVFFDKDGIVLQSLPEPMDGVPVVSGIQFGKFTINEAFDVEEEGLFDVIMNISRLISHYKVPVDEIRFEGDEPRLYSGEVIVKLGKKDFYDDDMAALASVLKKARRKKLAGTINMEHYQSGDKIILKTEDASAAGQSDEAQTDTGQEAE